MECNFHDQWRPQELHYILERGGRKDFAKVRCVEKKTRGEVKESIRKGSTCRKGSKRNKRKIRKIKEREEKEKREKRKRKKKENKGREEEEEEKREKEEKKRSKRNRGEQKERKGKIKKKSILMICHLKEILIHLILFCYLAKNYSSRSSGTDNGKKKEWYYLENIYSLRKNGNTNGMKKRW